MDNTQKFLKCLNQLQPEDRKDITTLNKASQLAYNRYGLNMAGSDGDAWYDALEQYFGD